MRIRPALYSFATLCALLATLAAGIASQQRPISASLLLATPRAAEVETKNESKPVAYTAVHDGSYQVVHVVDGDTLDIAVGDSIARLRLIGMDTPEVVDPRKPVQCFGREASEKAHELLDGKQVLTESDPSQGTFDKYGRTLEYVRLPDGMLYNEYMIASGYAHEYTYHLPYKYQAAFKADEKAARENQLGFWAPGTCDGNTKQATG